MNNGIKNECELEKSINNIKFCDLNDNLKSFVKFIFNDIKEDDILKCKRYKTFDKADIYIKLNNEVKNISVKSGTRISVHAEKIETFIEFLKDMHIRKGIIDFLLLYHYGDFTIDGKGNVRLPAKELKERYQKEIKLFNKYINHKNIIKKVIERCLFDGTSKNNMADYIYYGNIEGGLYASKQEIINYFCSSKALEIESPHFSYLTYQNWNRNIVNNPKLEPHRYYCQFKWPSIVDDLKNIRNH